MKKLTIASIGIICLSTSAIAAPTSAKDAFSKMKSLVGTWEQSNKHAFVYRLTGGGSALMETMMPGGPEEMVSVYHLDKDRLMMTHYCAAQNQPTLKLVSGDGSALHFVFESGTNMDKSDMHIHDVKIKFIDKDHIQETWQSFTDGKPSGTMNFELHRVSKG